MGKLVVCNAPMLFTGMYALVKGWIDEKTRKKISIQGSGYLKYLREYCDDNQIPVSLGGTNEATFLDDCGPWKEYELVDSQDPNAKVGVRLKSDPEGKIFGPRELAMLENPVIDGFGAQGTKGAVIIQNDGQIVPNFQANKSTIIDDDKYVDND